MFELKQNPISFVGGPGLPVLLNVGGTGLWLDNWGFGVMYYRRHQGKETCNNPNLTSKLIAFMKRYR